MTEQDDDASFPCACVPESLDSVDDATEWTVEIEPIREGPGFAVYELLPRLTFSWGSVAASQRLSHVLNHYVPLASVPEAMLIVRIHDKAIGSGAVATFVVESVSLSADEPETAFAWALELARIRVDATSTVGTSMIARLRADVGTHLRLRVDLDQSAALPNNALTVSADLVARTQLADEEDCRCAPA